MREATLAAMFGAPPERCAALSHATSCSLFMNADATLDAAPFWIDLWPGLYIELHPDGRGGGTFTFNDTTGG